MRFGRLKRKLIFDIFEHHQLIVQVIVLNVSTASVANEVGWSIAVHYIKLVRNVVFNKTKQQFRTKQATMAAVEPNLEQNKNGHSPRRTPDDQNGVTSTVPASIPGGIQKVNTLQSPIVISFEISPRFQYLCV